MAGSLRVFAKKNNYNFKNINKFSSVNLSQFKNFKKKIKLVIKEIQLFVNKNIQNQEPVYGIGAATKGNTLLNCCGFDDTTIKFILDRSKHKINKFTPGSAIKIIKEKKNLQIKVALILPWNISKEIMDEYGFVKEWGAKFVTAVPKIRVIG